MNRTLNIKIVDYHYGYAEEPIAGTYVMIEDRRIELENNTRTELLKKVFSDFGYDPHITEEEDYD